MSQTTDPDARAREDGTAEEAEAKEEEREESLAAEGECEIAEVTIVPSERARRDIVLLLLSLLMLVHQRGHVR